MHNDAELQLVERGPSDRLVMNWCEGSRHEKVTTLNDKVYALCLDGRLASGPPATKAERVVQTRVVEHRGGPASTRVSPDGTLLGVATPDGVLSIVSVADGSKHQSQPLEVGPLSQLQWSPDGTRMLVTSTAGPAVVYSTITGGVVEQIPNQGALVGRWYDDHTILLVDETHLSHWTLPEGARPAQLALGAGVSTLDISSDGQLIAIGRGDGRVSVHDLQTGIERASAVRPDKVCKSAVFLADDSRVLATYAQADTVLVIDPTTGAVDAFDTANSGRFRRLLSLQGPRLVGLPYSRSGARGFDPTGALDPILTIPGKEFWEGDDAHGRRFAVALSMEGAVYRFESTDEPRVSHLWDTKGANAIDITADGQRVAVALDGGRGVEVREASSGEVVRAFDGGPARLSEVAWSADGAWLAVGDIEGNTRLYQLDQDEPVALLDGHEGLISALEFTPDGALLATGSWDGAVRLWDLQAIRADPREVLTAATAAWDLSVDTLLQR